MGGYSSRYPWLESSHRWLWHRASLPPPAAVLGLLELRTEDAAAQVNFHRDSPVDPRRGPGSMSGMDGRSPGGVMTWYQNALLTGTGVSMTVSST